MRAALKRTRLLGGTLCSAQTITLRAPTAGCLSVGSGVVRMLEDSFMIKVNALEVYKQPRSKM